MEFQLVNILFALIIFVLPELILYVLLEFIICALGINFVCTMQISLTQDAKQAFAYRGAKPGFFLSRCETVELSRKSC